MDDFTKMGGSYGANNPNKTEELTEFFKEMVEFPHNLGIGTKKIYKYPIIKLYLNPEREELLKNCLSYIGGDPGRVDDRSQEIIWDILLWVEPLLRFRNRIKDIVRDLGFKEVDLK